MQTKLIRSATLLTILVAAALAFPLSAKDKKQVTRPLKNLGLITVAVTPISETVARIHCEEDGNSTLTGRYHNVGNGTMSLMTGQFLDGEGTLIASNGDTLHWFLNKEGIYVIDEGTGRFNNVFGFLVMSILAKSDPGPIEGGFTFTVLYEGNGELTF